MTKTKKKRKKKLFECLVTDSQTTSSLACDKKFVRNIIEHH